MTTTVIPTRPRICIAIPAYNAARTLRATLDSIVSQEYDAWEVSAVDDGSTDDTAAILAEYAARDPRVHFVSQPNAGTGAALNTAFRNARAEFIAQFGADDELLPGYMTTMAAFMDEHPGFDIYSCNAWIRYGRHQRLYVQNPESRPWVSMTMKDLLEGQPYLFAGGALIRRSLFEDVGGFRPHIYVEDVDFWRRCFATGAKHIYCPQPLVVYSRSVKGQKTADRRRVLESVLQVDMDLLESGVDEQTATLLRESIARTRALLAPGELARIAALERMDRQAVALRAAVVRAFGEARGERVLRMLHVLTPLTRPIRHALNVLIGLVRDVQRRHAGSR